MAGDHLLVSNEVVMKTRNFVIALLILLLAVAFFWKYVVLKRFGRELDAPAILTQVQQLSDLVTVRYSIQRVVGLTEQKQPFGSESILLMVQGEAQAGIDLSKIKPQDVQLLSDGSVEIALPPARLTSAFLDENQIKVWDRSVTWWTPWVPYDPDLEHKARLQALDDVRSAALQMGIVRQAQRNAEVSIRDLLGALHLQVKYKPLD